MHVFGKVRRYLEELAEVPIVGLEQEVEHALADQHHLEIDGNGLRLEGRRAGKTQHPLQRLDPDLAGSQYPLECVPGKGVCEQAQGVEYQEAAVGAVQRAGFDEAEVGDESAHVGNVLDAADEIDVAGVVLVDHWCPVQVCVVHQQVDAIAHKRRVIRARCLALLAVPLAKGLCVVDDISLDCGQIVEHYGQVGVVDLELGGERVDSGLGDLAIELLETPPHFPLPERDLTQGCLQILPQLVDDLADSLFFFLSQLSELLRAQDLPLSHGCQGVAVRGMNQCDAPLLGLAADGTRRLFFPIFEFLLDRLGLAVVFRALKGRWNGVEQVLNQLVKIGAQLAAAARGKA